MLRFISTAVLLTVFFSSDIANAAYDPAAGKAIYNVSCSSCHKNSIMGAPKIGDKAAWAPRIAQGVGMLVSKSIKGFKGSKGMMPPKGGNPKLTDAQVGNAVSYIVQQSK